jgi:hypothetical protein
MRGSSAAGPLGPETSHRRIGAAFRRAAQLRHVGRREPFADRLAKIRAELF